MENTVAKTVAKVVKVSAIVCAVLSFLGGIVLGCSTAQEADGFNFSVAFSAWIGSFLGCLLIYAVGEVISLLQNINDTTLAIYNQNAAASTDEKPMSVYQRITTPVENSHMQEQQKSASSSSGYWMCKKCGERNGSSDRFCKSCGEYK